MRRRRAAPGRAEAATRGSVALELAAGVALLVVPVALVVLSLPEWSLRQAFARVAARDAARALTLEGTCSRALARDALGRLADGAPVDAATVRIDVDCPEGAPLARAGALTVRVTIDMPALVVPVVGAVAGWTWTAVHRATVDPYGSRP